jgi:hypothetical protein
MAIVVIDTSTDPEVFAYRQFVDLEQRTYLFRLDWNERDESWSLSIYDQDEEPLVTGKRVSIGADLMRGEVDNRLPQGILMAVDVTQQHGEAGVSDLGARVKLTYTEVATIEAIEAAVAASES